MKTFLTFNDVKRMKCDQQKKEKPDQRENRYLKADEAAC